MADVEQQQGGPTGSSSRRRKHAGKSKTQTPNDWSRTAEPRSRASPRSSKRHGDIDRDIVESSDDANDARASPRKPPRRRRPPQPPGSTTSATASDTTAPAKAAPPRSQKAQGRSNKNMRVPNASVPVLDTVSAHRRPTCIIEEDDDDDDGAPSGPSGPSRPTSRQTIARRESSPRSAHRYRSTPESRRSPRTSRSDSDDDTNATSDSDEEQVIQPRAKHLPPVPIAPPVPPAPPARAVHGSLQERLSRRPEMVYEEDDGDGTSRYAPSARHRSLSRPASSRHDPYRRPRDIAVSGPPSLDETRRSRSRSKSARPSRRHYESDVYISSRPASSFKRNHAASSYSIGSSAKRSTFFAADFAAPPTRPSRLEKPAERTTVCVSCRNSNTLVSETVKLKCCHRMCHTCLRNVFKLSLTDPQQHMPPRCCTADNISPEYIDLLFDPRFKKEWQQKYREHTGRNRIQCPSRQCDGSMKPEDMRREGGHLQGRCSRCRIRVCGSCSGRWHHQTECPRDDEAIQFPEPPKQEWHRCRRCKAMVEVKDGRNHITCRCGAESCLACGGKSKMCGCPDFKYDPFETDMNSRGNPFSSRPPSPRELRSDYAPSPAAAARIRPSSYEEDAHIRRIHEQRDDHLARRMHSFDAFGHHGSHADFDRRREDYEFDEPREPRDRRRRAETRVEYGAPFVDDDYHRRAATVVAPSPPQAHVPAAPPPPRSAFEPPSRPAFDRSASGFEYGAATQRSRGMRYESPARYDEYATEDYPPERRRPRSPDRWEAFSQDRRTRSRDRRHTFPSESRPTSPDTWQLPTRYPSPERPMPAPEPERRRAPSPERDRRRASSLERRLAGRFKKESRQNPAAAPVPIAAAGTVSHLGGPAGALSTARVPPPVSRAATHIGTSGMPMAPAPPPAPAVASLRRHHTMDEDVYGSGGGGGGGGGGMPPPGTEWFGPPLPHGHPHAHPHSHPPPPGMGGMGGMPMMQHHGHGHPGMGMGGMGGMGMGMGMGMHPDQMMMAGDMNNPAGMGGMGMGMGGGGGGIGAGSHRAPNVRRRPPPGGGQQQQAHREHSKYDEAVPRSSVLAGLGGMGRGVHRVSEWVCYVEEGLPDGGTVVQ